MVSLVGSSDDEDDPEWQADEASEEDERDEAPSGRRAQKRQKKQGGSISQTAGEPLHRAKVQLHGTRFRPELRTDEDGIYCYSNTNDMLAVSKLSPWPIPLQGRVYGATQLLDPRAINRIRPYLDNPDDWVVATAETFTMLIQARARPKLAARLPRFHEFVLLSRHPLLAFNKRNRGALVLQDLLEHLKAIAIEEGDEELGDVLLFQVGGLRPFDGGIPSTMAPPEGQPGLTGKLFYDFCTGRSHTGVATRRTALMWIDIGVQVPFEMDDDGKAIWPLWQRRTRANMQADPPVFGGQLSLQTCAMHGHDNAGWVTVRWDNSRRSSEEKFNEWLRRQVLEGLAAERVEERAAAAGAAEGAAGEEGAADAEPTTAEDGIAALGPDILEGNSPIWLRPIVALEQEPPVLTMLDLYILMLPVSKATLYWSFRHEWAEWIDGGGGSPFSTSFPPKSLAPLHNLVHHLKEAYGPYLNGEDGADPERLFGDLLTERGHYSRHEITYNFRSIGVRLPPDSVTVSRLARALQAVIKRAVPLDSVPMSEERWVQHVSESLELLSELLDKVPRIWKDKDSGESKPMPLSLSDMPESVQIEWLGRAGHLRLDVGDTSAHDQSGNNQMCYAKRYVADWRAQLANADWSKELLEIDGCSEACLLTEGADRRRRINDLVKSRTHICKKGPEKGRRVPNKKHPDGGKQTVAKLRAEVRKWNDRLKRGADVLRQHGTKMELIRQWATATVDEENARARRVANGRRGELRGAGRGEKLPCDIPPDLSSEDRHEELVKCAMMDETHLASWVEDLQEGRTDEDQMEWDPDAPDDQDDPEPEEDEELELGGEGNEGEGEGSGLGNIFNDLPLQGFS